MDKITAAHLGRTAYVLRATIDCRSAGQQSGEPTASMYALGAPGPEAWDGRTSLSSMMISVVRAGASCVRGFDRLLSAICSGSVGAVLAIEFSRLARNGRDWHTLIEFCALVGSLITR